MPSTYCRRINEAVSLAASFVYGRPRREPAPRLTDAAKGCTLLWHACPRQSGPEFGPGARFRTNSGIHLSSTDVADPGFVLDRRNNVWLVDGR